MKWFERGMDTVHDEKNILGFFEPYRWLSNFHVCLVEYEGVKYSSSEAAYQAAKTLDPEERHKFSTMTPSASKKEGQKVTLRSDWDEVKQDVMRDILYSKFTLNLDLRKLLIDTGKKYLEETNWWNDTYWGVCNGKGQNNLGKILMEIRERINTDNYD